jgi:hypothetical protein
MVLKAPLPFKNSELQTSIQQNRACLPMAWSIMALQSLIASITTNCIQRMQCQYTFKYPLPTLRSQGQWKDVYFL